jgi:hypothetical protein
LTAFVSGLLLYCAAIGLSYVLIDLWLLPMLRPLFRSYLWAALAVAGVAALLVFAMAVGWSFLTVRVPAGSRRPTTAWCLAGIGAGCLSWVVAGVFSLALNPMDKAMSVVDLLLIPSTPPLWGPLNSLAVVAGAMLAGSLARRIAPVPSRSARRA